MQETCVRSLGWKDPLEKRKTLQSSGLENSMDCIVHGVVKSSDMTERLSLHFKPVNLKRNQPWIFTRSTDAEAPILWSPDAKSLLMGKDPDDRKDWRQKGSNRGWDGWMALLTQWTWVWANSMRWWRIGKLTCYSPWDHKELDTTYQLNNNNKITFIVLAECVVFLVTCP